MVEKGIPVILCFVMLGVGQNIWVETTQNDFADGICEHNIYASHVAGGAIEFAPRFDLNQDGYIDIVTCDIGGPYVTLFWGGVSGYSPGNSLRFPSTGAGDCDCADLDQDGYSDFIVTHANYDSRIAVYWGSASGPSPGYVFNIPNAPEVPNEVAYAADLNKDGYLDIVAGTYMNLNVGAIFWGSVNGYSPDNRTELPTQYGAHNAEIADLNKDNWLDVIFVNNYGTHNYIYWGSASGYSVSNMTSLQAPQSTPHGASVADLDGDGYLDLVFTSVYGSQSYIYYGTPSGYLTFQALNTGSTYGGSAVCDMNQDEYLDIVFFRGWPSSLKPVIYWGSSTGYTDMNRTEVGQPLYGDGGFVADLNGDGHYDILVNSRSPQSMIFWGPYYSTSTSLPVYDDHHALFREIGNTYDRDYYEDYVSSVFDAGATADWGTIDWDDDTPAGTSVLFWVRSGSTSVPDGSWTDWFSIGNGDSIPEALSAQYLQYKTRLVYTNPCYLPRLNEVSVTYISAGGLVASLRIEPETINLQSHGRFTAFITLPPGYSHNSINTSTVCCHGAYAVSGHATPNFFIAKFNVQDLVGVMPGTKVEFIVTGQLFDGTDFIGYDTVRVIGVPTADAMCKPNPFSTKTTISVMRAESENIRINIYDVTGKLIRTLNNIQYENGCYSVDWDRTDHNGRKVAAGVYLYAVEGVKSVLKDKIIVLD
jgi:hypothetical protein